jgi:hypothetical protein
MRFPSSKFVAKRRAAKSAAAKNGATEFVSVPKQLRVRHKRTRMDWVADFFAATHHRFAMHDKNSSMIAAKIVCWRILFVPTLCQTTKAAQAHGGRAVAVPKEERS